MRKRGYLIRFGHTEALLLKKMTLNGHFSRPAETDPYVTRHSSYFLLQGVKINKIHLERTEASVHDPLVAMMYLLTAHECSNGGVVLYSSKLSRSLVKDLEMKKSGTKLDKVCKTRQMVDQWNPLWGELARLEHHR